MVSKIIRLLDGEYSHIALALSPNVILEAQRFTESRIVKSYETNYDKIELTLSEYQLSRLNDVALELIGYKYDYMQVFSTLFQKLFKIRRKNNREKFICSELIVELLYAIDYISTKEYTYLADSTPNELYTFLKIKENYFMR